jgi:hypothetical protein
VVGWSADEVEAARFGLIGEVVFTTALGVRRRDEGGSVLGGGVARLQSGERDQGGSRRGWPGVHGEQQVAALYAGGSEGEKRREWRRR